MEFDVSYIVQKWPDLMSGLWMTCLLTIVSIVLSLMIGLIGAACRLFNIPVLSQLVFFYVEFIRNTPILAQLFFIFYGLPAIGMGLSLFWSGILCLALWAGAYQIENIRGGLLSIDKGLIDASAALGFRPIGYFFLIALPVAIRTCLPSMLNSCVSLLKNSSYLQAIGLAELTFVAIDRIAMDFRAVEMFAAIGVLYILLVIILSFFARLLEHKLHEPFRRQG